MGDAWAQPKRYVAALEYASHESTTLFVSVAFCNSSCKNIEHKQLVVGAHLKPLL